jgi:hypothetical protein
MKFILIITIALLASSCGPRFNAVYYNDPQNPCTMGQHYFSKVDCEDYINKYPKNHRRYLNRIDGYKKAGMKMHQAGKKPMEIKAYEPPQRYARRQQK